VIKLLSTVVSDIKTLSSFAIYLLKYLEREPEYVKKFIEGFCEQVEKGGWEQLSEKSNEWIKIFERDGYILKIAFIHQRKGEKITGADLLFQIKNKKIIFIQSKRVNSRGRFTFNRYQLKKLIELENEICEHIFPRVSLFYYLNRFYPLACFYHLIMKKFESIEERLFHISDILFILGGRKSAPQIDFLNQGLKKDEFFQFFWSCKIGCPDISEERKREILEMYSLITSRIVIWFHIEEEGKTWLHKGTIRD